MHARTRFHIHTYATCSVLNPLGEDWGPTCLDMNKMTKPVVFIAPLNNPNSNALKNLAKLWVPKASSAIVDHYIIWKTNITNVTSRLNPMVLIYHVIQIPNNCDANGRVLLGPKNSKFRKCLPIFILCTVSPHLCALFCIISTKWACHVLDLSIL